MPTPTLPTPRVPIQTPMFNEDAASDFTLTRTWVIFFERLFRTSGGMPGGPYHRTLLLKKTTVGDEIADDIPVYMPGKAWRVIGVLRKAITADLTVRLKIWIGGVSSVVGTYTIPSATAIRTGLAFTTFSVVDFPDLAVFTWDVTASDGSMDGNGVASFTLLWGPA